MKHDWMRIAAALVLMLAAAAIVPAVPGLTLSAGAKAGAVTGAAAIPAVNPQRADAACVAGTNATPAFTEPAEACRRLPECWVDTDCDLQCGAGLGKCVHSNCPIRVCHCR